MAPNNILEVIFVLIESPSVVAFLLGVIVVVVDTTGSSGVLSAT